MNKRKRILLLLTIVLFQIKAFPQFNPGMGDLPTECNITVYPTGTVQKPYSAGTFIISIGANSALCMWDALETASWISISPSNGQGGGSITVTYTENTGASTRTSNISVGGSTITLSQSPKPAPSAPATPSVTNNCGNSVLTRGNPPSGVTWYWQGTASGGTSTGNSASTYTVSSNGTYYLRARDNSTGLWSNSTGVSVTVKTYPTASVSSNIGTVTCSSPTATLTASGGGSYAWSTGSTATSIAVSPGSNTSYTVTVTNNGCSSTASQTIYADKAAPAASISANINTVTCSNPTATLTASGGGSYNWSTGETAASIAVSPITNTTYTVTVTGANGCTTVASKTISADKAAPTASISANINTVTCSNPTATLTASGGGSYNWSTGSTALSIAVSPTTDTIYTVTVTGANGCTTVASKTISADKAAPAASISANISTVTCSNPTASLTASGGGSYAWSTGETAASIAVSPITNTTYTVTITGANSCTSTASQTINADKAVPTASITANIGTVTCTNPTATLTASGGESYAWSTGETAVSIAVSPTTNTTYTVTVTGASGCTSTASQTINADKAIPTASITANIGTVTCSNPTATVTASGGGSYAWSTGETSSSIAVTPTSNTTYTVTITGANGCTSTANQTIYADQAVPAANIAASIGTVTCANPATTLTATGGESYVWGTGETTPAITVSPASTATYSVTVTGTNGCTATSNKEISVNKVQTNITAQAQNAYATDGTTATFGITAEGENLVYQWQESSDGGNTFTNISNANSATYSITANPGNKGNLYKCIVTGSCNTVTSNTAELYLIAQEGLIVNYPFNGNANDESGNNNNGTVHGAALTSDRFGNANSAYSFDGVDDFITLPDGARFKPSTSSSVSFWIKTSQTTRFELIEQRSGSNSTSNLNYMVSFNHPTLGGLFNYPGYSQNNNTSLYNITPTNFNNNEWHNFVYIKDLQTNKMKVYFNGLFLTEKVIADEPFNISGALLIAKNYLNSDYFQGSLDDIKIYNYALSESEIQELYNEPNPACIPEILSQPQSQAVCLGSETELKVETQGKLNWKDPGNWDFYKNVTWSEEKQAWMCIGYGNMYLKRDYYIGIDHSKSYSMKVEVLNKNSNSYLFWGGKRFTEEKVLLPGYTGSYDYTCTQGGKKPEEDVWVSYTFENKTGDAASMAGWGSDGCAYYAVGGLINHAGISTDTMYIRNIQFTENTSNQKYFSSNEIQYQWQKDGADIAGATWSTLKIKNINTSDAGSYTCVVSTDCKTIVSEAAILTTMESPVITTALTGQQACIGSNIQLNVAATGQNLTYQWQKGGIDIAGATAASFDIANLDAGKAGYYVCNISNSNCTVKTGAVIDLEDVPEIKSYTHGKIVDLGEPIELKVDIGTSLNWQDKNIWTGNIEWDEGMQAWKCKGYIPMYLKYAKAVSIDKTKSYNIKVELYNESSNHSFYWGGRRLTAERALISGDYYSVVAGTYPKKGEWLTYSLEGKTGDAAGSMGWGTEDCAYYAVGGLTNHAGTADEVTYIRNISFYNATDGIEYFSNTNYTYKWQKDGIDIPGATSPAYSIPAAGIADAGAYKCIVSNTCTSVESPVSNIIVQSEAPLAYYPFNTNATDESGNGFTGQVIGATPATDRYGMENGAYSFDGVDDEIQITSPNAFDFKKDEDFTISVWVKLAEISNSYAGIVTNGAGATATKGWSLLYYNNTINFKMANNVNPRLSLSTPAGAITAGEWANIIVTADRDNTASIYVNGQLQASADISAYNIDLVNSETLEIGRWFEYYYKGLIDDVKIYNKVLKSTEVKEVFTKGGVNHFNHNYVRKDLVLVEGITDETQVDGLSVEAKSTQYQYFDGLGRPSQTVAVKASPNKKDIVQHIEYDNLGRQVKEYLPYTINSENGAFRNNALNEQGVYYNTQSSIANSPYPFAERVFYNSPLNRLMQQGAPGADWQPLNAEIQNSGHTVKIKYLTNTTDEVINWEVDNNGDCIKSGYYAEGKLFKNEVTDENGAKTYEYKDFTGKTILKKANDGEVDLLTYYVYDDFGRLRYVLPPKTVDEIGETSTITATSFDELIYYYEYDSRGRMVKKKIPGAKEIRMVYDRRDRLVLTQDGNLYNESKWSFVKYDVLNRPVITGIVQLPNISYTHLVTAFENHTVYNEDIAGTESFGYTLNYSYPAIAAITESDLLTVSYYDNYDLISKYGYAYSGAAEFPTVNYETNPVNQVTGTIVWNLNSADYYVSVNYYDQYYRLIQSVSENHLDGKDRFTSEYDFAGKTLRTKHEQELVLNNVNSNIVEFTYNTYDHAGRMLKTEHQIGTVAANKKTLSEFKYNENGQLLEKNLAKNTSGKYLQSIDYKYNIRGWLTSMNNPGIPVNTDENLAFDDLFSMELMYNNYLSDLQQTSEDKLYNGNITAIKWGHQGDELRAYAYQYDKINRIRTANFGNANNWAIAAFDVAGRNNEPKIIYDKNGNIMSLGRKDETGNGLHNMQYRYNGNKLMALGVDGSDVSATDDYAYDNNGNMLVDDIKGLVVEYNLLNLPKKVDYGNGNYIEYIYNAMGTKLAQDIYTAGSLSRTTDYVGNIIYKDGSFQYLLTNEGRVNKPGANYVYEYHLKDHLGNVRVAFEASTAGPMLTQKSDYYPFGLRFNGSQNNDNKYLYNSKELQEGIDSDGDGDIDLPLDWYDYGARFYDAALGRFTTIDPLSERYHVQSTYVYAANNPILFIDKNGRGPEIPGGLRAGYYPIMFASDVLKEVQALKFQHPTWGNLKTLATATYNVSSGKIHFGLDVAGMVPVGGEIADGINGGIYLLEGNGTDAVLSFAGCIPVAGWAATSGKWAKNALRFAGDGFQSVSGLIFKMGRRENRLSHVLFHTLNDLNKPLHGVFEVGDNLLSTLDEAWSMAKQGGENVVRTVQDNGNISYVVDMGKKIGYEGGAEGSGEALSKIQIIIKEGTESEVITAFPVNL